MQGKLKKHEKIFNIYVCVCKKRKAWIWGEFFKAFGWIGQVRSGQEEKEKEEEEETVCARDLLREDLCEIFCFECIRDFNDFRFSARVLRFSLWTGSLWFWESRGKWILKV